MGDQRRPHGEGNIWARLEADEGVSLGDKHNRHNPWPVQRPRGRNILDALRLEMRDQGEE